MKLNYLFLFAGLSLCACKRNTESVLLRLKYYSGDEKNFVLDQNASSGSLMKMHSQTEISFMVDSATSNGVYVMTARVKGLKMDTEGAGATQHYDSRDKYTNMNENALELDKTFRSVLDAYYNVSLDDRGRITAPLKAPGAEAPIDMAEVQLEYPEKNIKIGDSWTGERVNKLFGSTNKYTYTVSDITKDKVFLKVNVDIGDIKGLQKLTGKLKGEGEYEINRANGQLIKSRIDIPTGRGIRAVISVTAQ